MNADHLLAVSLILANVVAWADIAAKIAELLR